MGLKIEFKNVTKILGNRTILDNQDMAIHAGEISIIIGPSGIGKSTTLRLINRLYEIDAGDILIGGISIREIEPLELRRIVGFISQVPIMFDGSVIENVTYGLTVGKQSNGDISVDSLDEAVKLLDLVGLDSSFRDRDASRISVGEQQRVAIARALMLSPGVMLMDEPTSAMDPKTEIHVEETIRRINSTIGTTFVIVTHSPEQAKRLGDRIFWLNECCLKEISKTEVESLMKGLETGGVADD